MEKLGNKLEKKMPNLTQVFASYMSKFLVLLELNLHRPFC